MKLDAALAGPDLYEPAARDRLAAALGAAERVKGETERLEAEWYQCQSALDSLAGEEA